MALRCAGHVGRVARACRQVRHLTFTDVYFECRKRAGRAFRQDSMLAYITSLLRFSHFNAAAPQSCRCRCSVASSAARSSTRYHQEWLASLVPAFAVHGDQVEVLSTPTDFYNTLKIETKRAKRRIVLSSLYLGTGHLEHELVDCIHQSLEQSPGMKALVLLDYTRGSRGSDNSSRTMLLPLLTSFEHNVQVSLYHTPDLRGWLKSVLPERYNETVGLQHMKIYLFDDNVMMSGANLSDSYFTNRQDRYIIFRNSARLANFFSQLVGTVASFSFQLDKDNNVSISDGCKSHPYKDKDGGNQFRAEAQAKVESLLQDYRENHSDPASSTDTDTLVYPLVQMGPVGIDDDHRATQRLLHELPEGSTVSLASGYFNLTDDYVHDVVHHSQSSYDILTAAPEANGFFGASGIAGAIPDAYTYILKCFYQSVQQAGHADRIKIYEYFRRDWTFHAKGIWCTLPGDDKPCMTLVGSPNFGYRSRYRDLEAQVAVITQNQHLQQQLETEKSSIYKLGSAVTDATFEEPNRRTPYWVSLVTNVIRRFF